MKYVGVDLHKQVISLCVVVQNATQRAVVKRQRLTQVAAAAIMGVDQPKVSALLNGRLANFSSERLMRFLTALGQDVDITVRAKPRDRAHGRIRVLSEARA